MTVTTLTLGSIIGSGIFILPGEMAALVPSPLVVLAIFVATGAIALAGALTLAELGGMFPREGGQYVYLRESMGRGWAFMFGWSQFWVISTGIIAALSLALARFAVLVLGLPGGRAEIAIALVTIGVLTTINIVGLRPAAWVQNTFTVAKVAALAGLVAASFLLADPDHDPFDAAGGMPSGFDLLAAVSAAGLAAVFAYDGWHATTFVSAEVRHPQRNVPLGLGLGTAGVVVVYLSVVLAYFWVLPAGDIAAIGEDGTSRIGAEAARVTLGGTGARLISVAAVVSIFGSVNAFVLSGPRLFRAAASDGLFWGPLSRTGRTGTPVTGLVLQAEWAAFLVLLSAPAPDAYLAIVRAIVFGLWLFHIPTAVGYFRLRRARPDAERPYRTWGHPVVPGLFLAAGLFIVGSAVWADVDRLASDGLTPGNAALYSSLWGSLIVASGLPFLLRKGGPSEARAPTPEP